MPRQRDYAKEYARRKERARSEGFRSFWEKRITVVKKSAPDYQNLTTRQQGSWHRAFRAVREMVDKGDSLRKSAKKQGTTPSTVMKYGSTWIEREGRRWIASQAFREKQSYFYKPEPVNIITENGTTLMTLSDSKALSEYGRYLNYVKGALHGYPDAAIELAKFEGRTFTDSEGRKHAYVTDRNLLIRLYDDGRVSMEEFYAEATR